MSEEKLAPDDPATREAYACAELIGDWRVVTLDGEIQRVLVDPVARKYRLEMDTYVVESLSGCVGDGWYALSNGCFPPCITIQGIFPCTSLSERGFHDGMSLGVSCPLEDCRRKNCG